MKVRAPFEFSEFKEGHGAHMTACHGRGTGLLGFFMEFDREGFTLCTSTLDCGNTGVAPGYKQLTVFNEEKP